MAGQNDPWMTGDSDNVTLSATPTRTFTIAGQTAELWLLKSIPGVWALAYLRTPAAGSDVDTTGSLNAVADILPLHSMLFVTASSTGAAERGLMVVRSNAAGVVDLSNLAAIGLSNTD